MFVEIRNRSNKKFSFIDYYDTEQYIKNILTCPDRSVWYDMILFSKGRITLIFFPNQFNIYSILPHYNEIQQKFAKQQKNLKYVL